MTWPVTSVYQTEPELKSGLMTPNSNVIPPGYTTSYHILNTMPKKKKWGSYFMMPMDTVYTYAVLYFSETSMF